MARDPEEYDAIAERVRAGLDVEALRGLLAELQGEEIPEVAAGAHPPDRAAVAIAALARKHAVIGPLDIPPVLTGAAEPAANVLLHQPVTRTSLTALDLAIAGAIERVVSDRTRLDQDEREARRLIVHADLLDAYMQLLNDLLRKRTTDG